MKQYLQVFTNVFIARTMWEMELQPITLQPAFRLERVSYLITLNFQLQQLLNTTYNKLVIM